MILYANGNIQQQLIYTTAELLVLLLLEGLRVHREDYSVTNGMVSALNFSLVNIYFLTLIEWPTDNLFHWFSLKIQLNSYKDTTSDRQRGKRKTVCNMTQNQIYKMPQYFQQNAAIFSAKCRNIFSKMPQLIFQVWQISRVFRWG